MSPGEIDLLVLGDCNPDLILTGDDLQPAFGQAERLAESAELTVGGSGAIMACGAARLGLRTAIAGVVGDDLFGRFIVEALRERSVETSSLHVDPRLRTGVTVVLARTEDRAMLTFPGTIAALSAAAVDAELLAAARHVHVASYFLQTALAPGLRPLLARARRRGASTSVDPNWDPAERWDGGLLELLGEVDMLLPNAVEACRIAGEDVAGRAAEALAARGPLVAVKLGPAGALAARPGRQLVLEPAPSVGEPVDSVGAGDSFDAGLVAALLSGRRDADALALGCACGALSTRSAGGTAAQPSLEEALAVLGARWSQ